MKNDQVVTARGSVTSLALFYFSCSALSWPHGFVNGASLVTYLPIGTRTLVMGVLNVTPDSFSDGAQFLSPDKALAHAEQMIADGADIIDIGGESTRPGAATGFRRRRTSTRFADHRRASQTHQLFQFPSIQPSPW